MEKAWRFLPKIFVEKFNKQGILVAELVEENWQACSESSSQDHNVILEEMGSEIDR